MSQGMDHLNVKWRMSPDVDGFSSILGGVQWLKMCNTPVILAWLGEHSVHDLPRARSHLNPTC